MAKAKKVATPSTPAAEGEVITAGATTGEAVAAAAVERAAKDTKNDVTRPAVNTKTGLVWVIADRLSAAAKAPAERKAVMEQCKEEGVNEATAATQYGRWRKYYGLKGAPKAVKIVDGEAPPAATVE